MKRLKITLLLENQFITIIAKHILYIPRLIMFKIFCLKHPLWFIKKKHLFKSTIKIKDHGKEGKPEK